MSGKTSQWGILIIILVGLAIVLFGMKKPATDATVETAKVEAKAETPPKKIITAKKATPRPVKVEAERAPILDNTRRSIQRN